MFIDTTPMKKTFTFLIVVLLYQIGIPQNRAILSNELKNKVEKYVDPQLETSNCNMTKPGLMPDLITLTGDSVGNTFYDLQSNYSMQNRIYLFEDSTIGVAWTRGMSYSTFPDRGTGYNYFTGTSWGPSPTQRIESDRTGWSAYYAYDINGEIVVSHIAGGSSQGLLFNRRDQKGFDNWTEFLFQGPTGHEDVEWPRMVTGGVNHSIIHLLYLTAPIANGGTLYQGMDGALLYSKSTDGGNTWIQKDVLINDIGPACYVSMDGDIYDIIAQENLVAILVGDNWHELALLKSDDSGSSWTKTIIWNHPYPLWSGAATSEFYCPDGSHALAFDTRDKIHVVFGINRTYSDGSSTFWFPFIGGLAYWNEDMPGFSNNLNALDPSFGSGSELIEDYNLIGWSQDINGNGQLDYLSESVNYYLGTSSMPQIVIDEKNCIFVVYSSLTETYDNGNQNYRHLWMRGSPDDGQTWEEFIDLNSDIEYVNSECVFPSCSPTSDDYIHLVYQIDDEPGMAVRGDLDPYGENYIEYMQVHKSDIITYQTSIDTFPYSESFELEYFNWYQSFADDFDWIGQTGPTPTSGTGPDAAYDGSYYLYAEADEHFNQTCKLTANFDFSGGNGLNYPALSFWYHMYTYIYNCELSVEVSTDGGNTWTEVWSVIGNKGTLWRNAIVDLSDYGQEPDVIIQFKALMGDHERSDIAIDYVEMYEQVPPVCTQPVMPLDGEIYVNINTVLEWDMVDNTNGYRLYFGTDSPPTNVENGTDLGSIFLYVPDNFLSVNTTYYWEIIPYNSAGEASACTEWSFTTVPNIPELFIHPDSMNFILHPNEADSSVIYIENQGPYDLTFNVGNKAIDLDGVDDYVNCGNSPSLKLDSIFTLEAWIYPVGWGEVDNYGYGRIVDKETIILFLYDTDFEDYNEHCFLFAPKIDGNSYPVFTPVNSIQLNTWQHVAVTYNGITTLIYINGILQTTGTTIGFPSGPVDDNSLNDLLIGESVYQQRAFEGAIDEVRIWNKVRSIDEINNNLYRHLNGNEEGLLGYWTFNNETAFDFSGNGNNGVVQGGNFINRSNDIDWLAYTPDQGISTPFSKKYINVNVHSAGLNTGLYETEFIISSSDPFNPMHRYPVNLEVTEGEMIRLRAFLEGPMDGSQMTTDLNSQGLLPFTQPYNTAPWFYNGNEDVSAIPNPDVTDWVLIELRETTGDVTTAILDSTIACKAGFILNNGNVVDIDGLSPLVFDATITGNLYGVVWQRNHLSIMSGIPITKTGNTYTYDFTSGINQVVGGSLGCKLVGPNIYGMIAGDGNADGQVDNRDKNEVWFDENIDFGYFTGDYNMDGHVNDNDKNTLWKSNAGKSSSISYSKNGTGWNHSGYDLAGSFFYPFKSKKNMDTLITLWQFSGFNLTSENILSGDVTGDRDIEVITVQSHILYIISSGGEALQTISVGISGQNLSNISMLEDIDNNKNLEIGISYYRGTSNYGIGKARLYDGNGTLIQEFSRNVNSDVGLMPFTYTEGDIICGEHSAYGNDPRGFSRWNIASGLQVWYYDVGPNFQGYSIADINNDNVLELAYSNGTPHNGATGNGTSDGDNYTIIIDEFGNNILTQIYTAANSNGKIYDKFIQFEKGSEYNIVTLKTYDSYYTGNSRIHKRGIDGSYINSYIGQYNSVWYLGWADIDNDQKVELIATNNSQLAILYVFDDQLNVQASLNLPEVDYIFRAIADINGDGEYEIIISSTTDKSVIGYDENLNQVWIWHYPSTENIQNLIVSDNNRDGRNDLCVLTDNIIYCLTGGNFVNK